MSKSAYPASPRNRIELEKHIQELLKLKVIRKVSENEEGEITTPCVVALHNEISRVCGDFRGFNAYTVPERYPLPNIYQLLINLSKAMYITTMDLMKGFYQNVVEVSSRKYLRIISHL